MILNLLFCGIPYPLYSSKGTFKPLVGYSLEIKGNGKILRRLAVIFLDIAVQNPDYFVDN
jgi:hypothetical protein